MKKILKTAGVLHLLYYALIISYAGMRTTFSKFWLLTGVFFMALTALPGKLLSWLKVPMGIGVVYFIFQEFELMRMAHARPETGADYVIILGAQVKGTQPSRSLLRRIQAGAVYLKENPEAKIIASGGRGPGENITEAACIRETLMQMGIDRERILTEEVSASTRENLLYSMVFGGRESSYVIVTNGFHLFRAMETARRLGMAHVSGLAASSEPVLLWNYYVREFFALILYRLQGKAGRIK